MRLHMAPHSSAAAHLARLPLSVDLAQAGPLPQLLRLRHSQQADVVLRAQRLNQLLVVRLVAVLRQYAQLALRTQKKFVTGRAAL